MSPITAAHEMRTMTDDDLEEKLRAAKEELFNLRFQAATGQLESHGRLRSVRREIARIYTILRERELGITEPIDTEPIDTEPIDTEPVDPKVGETEPGDTEPVDPKVGETEPGDTELSESEPAEPQPVASEDSKA
jgi:large subunit ribosomal protein L29